MRGGHPRPDFCLILFGRDFIIYALCYNSRPGVTVFSFALKSESRLLMRYARLAVSLVARFSMAR